MKHLLEVNSSYIIISLDSDANAWFWRLCLKTQLDSLCISRPYQVHSPYSASGLLNVTFHSRFYSFSTSTFYFFFSQDKLLSLHINLVIFRPLPYRTGEYDIWHWITFFVYFHWKLSSFTDSSVNLMSPRKTMNIIRWELLYELSNSTTFLGRFMNILRKFCELYSFYLLKWAEPLCTSVLYSSSFSLFKNFSIFRVFSGKLF